MSALNFLARHAPAVESGAKCQTVRQRRKHPIVEGETLYLFTGMRTPACRRLRTTQCTLVRDINVTRGGTLKLDGTALSRADADAFAVSDGLPDWTALRDFLEAQYGLPFRGVVIYWPCVDREVAA